MSVAGRGLQPNDTHATSGAHALHNLFLLVEHMWQVACMETNIPMGGRSTVCTINNNFLDDLYSLVWDDLFNSYI